MIARRSVSEVESAADPGPRTEIEDKAHTMKTISSRDTALALLGMLSLAVYILACTSFSPNDRQVLYPAFDESGAVALASRSSRSTRTSSSRSTSSSPTGGRMSFCAPARSW